MPTQTREVIVRLLREPAHRNQVFKHATKREAMRRVHALYNLHGADTTITEPDNYTINVDARPYYNQELN